MAPAINTNTCCHVGLVKPCLNGSIQAASLARPTPAIRPPNPIGERLDRIESAANPWCDHKGFKNDAPSENGQSRADVIAPAGLASATSVRLSCEIGQTAARGGD